MPNPRATNVFAKFSFWLGIASFLSLLAAAGAHPPGELIILVTLIGSPTAILASIIGLGISKSTGGKGVVESVIGGLLGILCVVIHVVAVPDIGPAAQRMKSSNNLKKIALATHNYHDAKHKLPFTVQDHDGKPLLSMRVLLLPYLEEEELYREFHLDEPWDSPHNLTLLDRMPKSYQSPRDKSARSNMTFYRFVTGPGTAFDRDGLTLDDIKDGLSETMFALEAGEAVPWTKPDEWEYHPDQPLPAVGGIFGPAKWYEIRHGQLDGANVLFGNGSIRFITRDAPERFWRAIATRAGGEKVVWP